MITVCGLCITLLKVLWPVYFFEQQVTNIHRETHILLQVLHFLTLAFLCVKIKSWAAMPPSIVKFMNKTNSIRPNPSLTNILICIIYYAGGWIYHILLHTKYMYIIPHNTYVIPRLIVEKK